MSSRTVRARKTFNRLSLQAVIQSIRLISWVLPYWLAVRLGAALGLCAYFLLPRDRNRAISHLGMVYQDQGAAWIRRTARRNFIHLGRSLLELMVMTPRRLERSVRFEGLDNLEHALQQGKGALFYTGHIGNWELLGAAVGRSFPLSAVAVPIVPENVNDLLLELRARFGIKTILRGRPGASRELIRIFRENRILGMLIDQDTDVESAFVDFMGRPAWTPTAAASIALKFGAAVLFGYIRRDQDGHHVVTIEGPLVLTRTGNEEQDIVTNTAQFTRKIEEAVRRYPEQWVWMHRRWRRQP
ncbi:MAG: hypothetical protein A2X56_03105 [Nitrospirae bacterium GWC2_57_13]|jgi:Kdo2-lipid IVA lauroyltransferase/acyltransferase|nr:MAG: hypothetical protein A2072_04735 [Nitrospirae bacterium GWC1_57_7]OGW27864.1 MAG: hypothetical protein A2X56_03105 [Nitrospirae bacterium GWC2_57_13]OGW45751.1 MAG: hypothetical protein A2X57_04780 [Nitrospirae bacterium GWD2_57_8]HAR46629.1 lipid A biosynthesis acyltransferase [Nitrospiraceae bacterium]HAS53280.1 lipid A biosynthesis acyltransferase [Nitrospiraceae bacterium]